MTHILSIDQGTTSTRSIIFNSEMEIIAINQIEFKQHFPQSGWVEHDPQDLWSTTLETCHNAMKKASLTFADITAIGITNQRETVIVWDKFTGEPIYNAIVWQDRRTADQCASLRDKGHEVMISERTGLLLDPYFSGTKLNWILDNVEGARDRADTGDLLFGTVDSFLIWKFTNGEIHATDATNAARTMLYDIREGYWSKTICRLLNIPTKMLPEVKNSADDFGKTHKDIFGTCIPIRGVAGDQQAAMIGQACFEPGMMKATYGTGCFALLNTGLTPVASKSRLLTTIAYQFNGQPTYALEGSIFVAGAVVQWLRDSLKIIKEASETEQLAMQADESQKITIVPAFVGLGAPHWNSECRGAVFGLTRSTCAPEMARAALESVGFQTRDLLEAMSSDWHTEDINATLRVDGGMSSNDWAMKFLSDIIGASVDRSATREATALGVAWLAGMEMGVYPDQFEFSSRWAKEKEFKPTMNDEDRERKYLLWKRSVEAALSVPI